MREKCDLERLLEEILEDEKLDQSGDRILSQETILKMVAEKRRIRNEQKETSHAE